MPLDGGLPDHPDAELIVWRALARAAALPPPRTVDEWAEAERVVPPETGTPWPGRWRTDHVPYLREIMRVMTLSHPCRRVTLLKSAQVGGSEAALSLLGQVMAETPAPCLVMLPSIDMMRRYNRTKLDPMIRATPALSRRVTEIVSRDEQASSSTFKAFPGGFVQLVTANSSSGLQMTSARVVIREEVAEYPDDVDGRGDPSALIEARALLYKGREKIVDISTPALEGACRVTAAYDLSSRGAWHIACPHCGERQPFEWEDLRWPKGRPEEAAYHCRGCGATIEHAQKNSLIAAGEWIHERPELLTEHAGYRINGLYSPVMTWGEIAAEWERTDSDMLARKVFVQQKLGRAWREAGEVPDWERLFERREEWPRGTVPLGALILTAGVDVQRDRVECYVWGWGRQRRSWLIDKIVVIGSPAAWGTWEQVAAMLEARYPHAGGGSVPISMTAVDSGDGVTTAEVYAFVRRIGTRRVIAVKGRDAQQEPIIAGRAMDVTRSGRRIGRLKIWLVGVSTLKGELYGQLRLRRGDAESGEDDLPGYVHLPQHTASEEVVRQLTAEELRRVKTRTGQYRLQWVRTRANEALDCRIYARAAAALLGIDRMTDAQWDRVAAEIIASRDAAHPPAVQGALTLATETAASDGDAADASADGREVQETPTETEVTSAVQRPTPVAPVMPALVLRPRSDWLRRVPV